MLSQVLPVLFAVLRVCDEPLRELLLEQLVVLIVVVRQHIRRFLPDLLGIMGEFWGRSSKIQHVCLQVWCDSVVWWYETLENIPCIRGDYWYVCMLPGSKVDKHTPSSCMWISCMCWCSGLQSLTDGCGP